MQSAIQTSVCVLVSFAGTFNCCFHEPSKLFSLMAFTLAHDVQNANGLEPYPNFVWLSCEVRASAIATGEARKYSETSGRVLLSVVDLMISPQTQHERDV